MWTWLSLKPLHSGFHLRQLLPFTSQPPSHFTHSLINRGKCKWINAVGQVMARVIKYYIIKMYAFLGLNCGKSKKMFQIGIDLVELNLRKRVINWSYIFFFCPLNFLSLAPMLAVVDSTYSFCNRRALKKRSKVFVCLFCLLNPALFMSAKSRKQKRRET